MENVELEHQLNYAKESINILNLNQKNLQKDIVELNKKLVESDKKQVKLQKQIDELKEQKEDASVKKPTK